MLRFIKAVLTIALLGGCLNSWAAVKSSATKSQKIAATQTQDNSQMSQASQGSAQTPQTQPGQTSTSNPSDPYSTGTGSSTNSPATQPSTGNMPANTPGTGAVCPAPGTPGAPAAGSPPSGTPAPGMPATPGMPSATPAPAPTPVPAPAPSNPGDKQSLLEEGNKTTAAFEVLELVLANKVEAREPQEIVENFTTENGRGFAFVRLSAREAAPLSFVWYRNGHEYHRFTTQVQAAKKWRTYASVKLQPGDWKVQVMDANNNLLSEKSFKVE